MCDDLTEDDNARFLGRLPTLDRRRFAALGAGAVTLASVPGCIAKVADQTPGMPVTGRAVAIPTPDGVTDGWFVAPTSGKHSRAIR